MKVKYLLNDPGLIIGQPLTVGSKCKKEYGGYYVRNWNSAKNNALSWRNLTKSRAYAYMIFIFVGLFLGYYYFIMTLLFR